MPLATYTTFGVGGTAALFVEAKTGEDIVMLVKAALAEGMPYRLIAGGSNVVCPEVELPGLTIRVMPGTITLLDDTTVLADAGVVLMDLVLFSVEHGLKGLETLSGIPGSFGGALVGNAGAYGRSVGESVSRVEIFDGSGVRWVSKEECHFVYRESAFKKEPWIVLRGELVLEKGDSEALKKRSREIVELRLKKYPPGLKCPGSFFKNVLLSDVAVEAQSRIDMNKVVEGKVPTGYLLESVGACGMKTEHLSVASYHGNLITNEGGATMAEVKDFSAVLKGLVRDRFGIELEEEVRYLS